jgi:negative regulator of sigma E activity
MTNNHLTEEILQAYLLNEIQDDKIATHLIECLSCQKKLEEYQILIDSVQKIKPEIFSFDVTTVVMEKIKEVETQKEKNSNSVMYLSLSSISIAALVLLYPYIKSIFTQFKLFTVMGNLFVLVSALGVTIFLLNDIIRQYKQKELMLLS